MTQILLIIYQISKVITTMKKNTFDFTITRVIQKFCNILVQYSVCMVELLGMSGEYIQPWYQLHSFCDPEIERVPDLYL